MDTEGWLKELPAIAKYYSQFGARLPKELNQGLQRLEDRLKAASDVPIHNKALLDWVLEVKALTKPANIHWVTGSDYQTPPSAHLSRLMKFTFM